MKGYDIVEESIKELLKFRGEKLMDKTNCFSGKILQLAQKLKQVTISDLIIRTQMDILAKQLPEPFAPCRFCFTFFFWHVLFDEDDSNFYISSFFIF